MSAVIRIVSFFIDTKHLEQRRRSTGLFLKVLKLENLSAVFTVSLEFFEY